MSYNIMYEFNKANKIQKTTGIDPADDRRQFYGVKASQVLYPYKTAEEKVLYEAQIPTRIRPHLTLHKESLGTEIASAQTLPVSDYLGGFEGAWNDHIAACDRIDTFLRNRYHSRYPQWCIDEIDEVRDLFIDAYATNRDKNIYSAGVKDKIEASSVELALKYDWTDEELQTCITPSKPAFHIRYNLDHMRLLGSSSVDSSAMRTQLAHDYHHDDLELLDKRLSNMMFYTLDAASLNQLVTVTEETVQKSQFKKEEFLLKYPEAGDIDKLIIFDNWNEYLYSYTQKAYPDLYLREEIIAQAKLHNISTNEEALAHSNDDMLILLDQMRNQVNVQYELPVTTYHQTTTSCGTSCVMSLAHKQIQHSRNQEYALWRRVGAPYNFPGGLGILLRELDFDTVYALDRDYHFAEGKYPIYDIETNEEAQVIVPQYTNMHDRATEMGMETINTHINFSDVVDGLKKGWFAIIGIHMPNNENLLHWVLAHGYKLNESDSYDLVISDPLGVFSILDKNTYDELVDTYMGRRIIFVNKDQNS